MSAALVALVAAVALRNAALWYDRPIPGVLIDPSGSISNIGLSHWAGKRLGLKFPQRITPLGANETGIGGKERVSVWNRAVVEAEGHGYLEAVVTDEHRRQVVRLELRPLEPLAWWVYAGSCIIAGLLYAGAGLTALWASPSGRLARAFAWFAMSFGLFLITLFDAHTERALIPVFFVAYGILPVSLTLVMLNLPTPIGALLGQRWPARLVLGVFAALGVVAAATYSSGGDVGAFQLGFSVLLGIACAVFVGGFLFRYALSRGEQQRTLRALLICTAPPYALGSVFMVLASLGVLRVFPDFLFFPAVVVCSPRKPVRVRALRPLG